MITFIEYLEEHPTIGRRILKKINPVEVIRDKIKTAKGGAKKKLKQTLDKINPLSDFNKARTMAKKKDREGLVDRRAVLKIKTKDVQRKIDNIDFPDGKKR